MEVLSLCVVCEACVVLGMLGNGCVYLLTMLSSIVLVDEYAISLAFTCLCLSC